MAVTTSAGQLYTMLACKEMVYSRCYSCDIKNKFGAYEQVYFQHKWLYGPDAAWTAAAASSCVNKAQASCW